MNTTQSLQKMRQLKLNGMAACCQSQLEQPLHQQMKAHELIRTLTQSEVINRNNE